MALLRRCPDRPESDGGLFQLQPQPIAGTSEETGSATRETTGAVRVFQEEFVDDQRPRRIALLAVTSEDHAIEDEEKDARVAEKRQENEDYEHRSRIGAIQFSGTRMVPRVSTFFTVPWSSDPPVSMRPRKRAMFE